MLSPLDLQSKKIQPKRKKYDKVQMDEYLELVDENYKELYTEYEKLRKENKELTKKIKTLSDGIQYYRSIESTMQKALVLAEKTSTETKDAAIMKAEAIEKDANSRAEKIISEAEQEYNKIRDKCITLVQQFNKYKTQLKQVATTQLELVTSESFEVDSPELNESFEDLRHEHAPESDSPTSTTSEAVAGPQISDSVEMEEKSETKPLEETVILPNLKAEDRATKEKADERDTMSILTADTIDLRSSIKKVQETEGLQLDAGESVEQETQDQAPLSEDDLTATNDVTVIDDMAEGITFVQDATVMEPVDAKTVEPLDAKLNPADAGDMEILEPDQTAKKDTPTLDSLLQSMNMGNKKSKGQEDDPFEFLGSVDDF